MSDYTLAPSLSNRPRKIRFCIVLLGAVVLIVVAMTTMSFSSGTRIESSASDDLAVASNISALGTLEPRTRIIRLAAPNSLEGTRVRQLFVSEGDWIEENTVIATLDTLPQREAAVSEARARVDVSKARLEQIAAGSKPGDILAREAELSRTETARRHAETEFTRAEGLASTRSISTEEFERRRQQRDIAIHELTRAEGLLASCREVREVDILLAKAEVESAVATLVRAETERNAARICAPFAGRILRVVARPGEQPGEGGIVEMGDTSEMHAVAEVYEADVPRVCVGQLARVYVPSLGVQLCGQVALVGQRVGRKAVLDNDPVTDTDARVVEVRIRLGDTDGRHVAGLSNARVHVVIESSPGK